MHVLVKLQSITEQVALEFQRDDSDLNEQKQRYVAKTCILHQSVTGSILVKMLMWLPYKKANLTLTEMFDLTVGNSTFICYVEKAAEKAYIIDIKGHINQRLRRFIKDDTGTNVSFHFRVDAEEKKGVHNVLVFSDKGLQQWKEQMETLIRHATLQVCDKISKSKNKSVHIDELVIYPLPSSPPWEIHFEGDGDHTKLKIFNENYPIKMDLRLKINGIAFMLS